MSYISSLDEKLKELSPRKKVTAIQPLFRDIDNLCNIWVQDMDEEVKYRKRKVSLSKIPIVGSIFEAFGAGEIEINDPILLKAKPHLLFIHDLYTK